MRWCCLMFKDLKHPMTPGCMTDDVPQCTVGCNNNLNLPPLTKQDTKGSN